MGTTKGNTAIKIVLALAIVGAAAYYTLAGARAEVQVAEVRLGKAVDAVPGSVTVFADRGLQELKVEGSGRVVECARLDPGATFAKGDILLRLDDADIVREMQEAKRAYENRRKLAELQGGRRVEKAIAEQQLDTAKRMLELGHASTEDVNKAQREVERINTVIAVEKFAADRDKEDLDQKIEADKRLLEKMVVRAPADGMVDGAKVYVGMLMSGGTAVATFYANERVVIAKVGEEDIAKVKLGDLARVQLLKYPGEDFEAKVSKILPFADPETRRYNVYLDMLKADPARLTPNSTGEVVITVGSHDSVPLVPRRAIFNGSKGPAVYVVESGRLTERAVEVGFRDFRLAEVTKGLRPGEKVALVEDIDLYRNGQRVTVKSPSL